MVTITRMSSTNVLKNFILESLRGVNMIILEDKKTWFNAFDVCKALEFSNPKRAVIIHIIEDEWKCELGGVIYISEEGMYSLLLKSNKGRLFNRWILQNVIPTIRRTGMFSLDNSNPEQKTNEIVIEKINPNINNQSQFVPTQSSIKKVCFPSPIESIRWI